MPFRVADLPALLADFGVPVTLGTTTVRGLLDREGELVLEEPGTSALAEQAVILTVPTGSLPGLAPGVTLVADGTTYRVRERLQVDDGALTRVRCVLDLGDVPPASAPPEYVPRGTAQSGATVELVIPAVPALTGSTLIVVLAAASLDPPDVEWGLIRLQPADEFRALLGLGPGPALEAATAEVYLAHNVPGGTHDLTVAFPGPTKCAATAAELRNLPASPYDVGAQATGESTAPSSGNAPGTEQPHELLFGAVVTAGPPGDAAGSWQGGFTPGQRVGTNVSPAELNLTVDTAYRVVTAGGIYAAAKTGITSRRWAAMLVALKAAQVLP